MSHPTAPSAIHAPNNLKRERAVSSFLRKGVDALTNLLDKIPGVQTINQSIYTEESIPKQPCAPDMLLVALAQQIDLLVHSVFDHGADILIFCSTGQVGISLDAIFRAVGQVIAVTKC